MGRRKMVEKVLEGPEKDEDRKIILALFNPQTDHKDGCLFKGDRRMPCQCGYNEAVGHYRWAVRRGKEIAAGHYGTAFPVQGPSQEDVPGEEIKP